MHLTAIVFDWAGTLVDHGSRAPVATLESVFGQVGLPISVAEARIHMGIAKRAHVASLLELPRVSAEWVRLFGGAPGEKDIDVLYADLFRKQLACLREHSDAIGGVPQALAELRGRGLRLGSTTGYPRPMLELLLALATEQGFAPDCAVCPEDVPGGGRPGPWMCYLNAIQMQVGPLWTMVKIGDTPSDIAEGRNAGMWTIGITRTGNEVGLTAREWEEAPARQKSELIANAALRLRDAKAHYLAESVADCVALIDRIEQRVAAGERP